LERCKSGAAYLVSIELGIMHVLQRVSILVAFCTRSTKGVCTTYLIPMFLDAALCAIGECLFHVSLFRGIPTRLLNHQHTLAISAQLWPWSRICFRRSSSWGVHGVLVRLFLLGGGTVEASPPSAGVGAGGVGAGIGWGGTEAAGGCAGEAMGAVGAPGPPAGMG
jgi:hypothetical protein